MHVFFPKWKILCSYALFFCTLPIAPHTLLKLIPPFGYCYYDFIDTHPSYSHLQSTLMYRSTSRDDDVSTALEEFLHFVKTHLSAKQTVLENLNCFVFCYNCTYPRIVVRRTRPTPQVTRLGRNSFIAQLALLYRWRIVV